MRLEPADVEALRPVIAETVGAVLDRLESDRAMSNGRIAYTEAEAAGLLGIPRHSLRDARLRGEIQASRIGRRIVYSRDSLLAFLKSQET